MLNRYVRAAKQTEITLAKPVHTHHVKRMNWTLPTETSNKTKPAGFPAGFIIAK